MRKLVLYSTLSLLGAMAASEAEAAIVFRSNEGWSVEGDASSKVESSAAEQMRKAEDLERKGDKEGAIKAYRGLVKRYELSVLAPKAQYKMAILLDRSAEYDKAYTAYETYLSKYPRGDDFETVVEAMFKIAKLFLDGHKKKVLGVALGSSMDRAKEMFEGIVKKAPFSKWAPLAQFNVGQALEKQSKYGDAIAAYKIVVSRYSSDAIADDAQYQIGYVLLKQYREGSYDRKAARDAKEAFEDFINRYPDSEKVPQAKENMATLEGGASKSTLDIAKFYDKTKSYKAAVIYYNDVIQNKPGTAESDYAKTRIAELKSLVGEDALKAGPERAETGARAASRRKLQAKVDTVSRPDYMGPPVNYKEPEPPAPLNRPRLRTSPQDVGPVGPAVEPALPEALPQDTALPKPPAESPAPKDPPADPAKPADSPKPQE